MRARISGSGCRPARRAERRGGFGLCGALALLGAGTAGLLASPGMAAEVIGAPLPWEMDFQPAASPVMRQLEGFHNGLLMPIITVISLFVLLLLLYIMVRYNARANPVASKTAHNTLVEVIWTVVPVVILVVIAVPSFRLLFTETTIPDADVTIKVTGHAWNWEYDYPDNGEINFTAVMVPEADLKPGQPRLLATDRKLVVPVNKNVHVLVTAADVLHSWAVPAFGVKIDAVPGRLNQTWFRAEREGVYFGQCSELCGKDHAFMPIEVHVVSEQVFAAWAEAAQKDVDEAAKVLAAADNQSGEKVAAVAAGLGQ